MIKKIKVGQLGPGMYINDINCGWLENPFIKKSFLVDDYQTVAKIIKQGIREVYIDTEKGSDIKDAPTEEESVRQTDREIKKMIETPDEEEFEFEEPEAKVSMKEELERAKSVRKRAKDVVTHVLQEARLGKQIDTEKVADAVNNMVESVFNNRQALTSLSRLKSKDEYTFTHSINVCVLMISFARGLKITKGTINEIGVGALLHDVGKMKVSTRILNKEGKLSAEEFEQMKTHVVQTRLIMMETEGISEVAIAVGAEHHERYDGTGYPHGLKGRNITKFGQMASVVDVYDAITSVRCYKEALDPAEALRKMFEWGKHHFNKKMVEHFIRCVGIYPVGTLVRIESGFLGVVIEPGTTNLLSPKVRVVFDLKNMCRISPRDIDLDENGNGKTDRILGHENPKKWKINPLRYIDIF